MARKLTGTIGMWQRRPRGWELMAYVRRGKPTLRYFYPKEVE